MNERVNAEQGQFEEPEVVTYNRDELAMETVFAGVVLQYGSDRNLKRYCRRLASRRALTQLLRILT